jgi:beta-glucosidase/6-phospho-beta-glucosidase/beta-galactosidase
MKIEEQPFIWAVGIENTFVTQVERGERPLDEYELTQHYQFWKEDLDRARESGATMIRYGIPWHLVEKEENIFDWSWIDEVMDYFQNHRELVPIIDLMHYGTPHWLKNEFANGKYPEYVARYAKEFAKRYGDFIKYYTPLNEPYVNAEFCGLNAVWPPYLEGLSGFYSLMMQLGKGIINTVNEIQAIVPDARFVHVDATKKYFSYDPRLQEEVKLWNENRFVMWELVQGRIDESHPLYDFMLEYGVSPDTLKWFQNHQITIDIVGLNYYPQFSVHEIRRDKKGYIIYPHILGGGQELQEIVEEAYKRYQRPIFITETSFRGSEEERLNWLDECYDTCIELKKNDIPLLGLTWFPFFDLVDWEYRTSGKSIEEELLPFGLYTLTMRDGVLQREKNRVGYQFEKLAKKKGTAVKEDLL